VKADTGVIFAGFYLTTRFDSAANLTTLQDCADCEMPESGQCADGRKDYSEISMQREAVS
jgi:hypothetical protein